VPQIQQNDRKTWIDRIKANKEKYPFTYTPSVEGGKLKPQEVMQEFDRQAEIIGSKWIVLIILGHR
jgi:acetolactate synthase-1/2/3 large subunit